MNRTITLDRVMQAVDDDAYIGFCKACGSEADSVEPDARRYRCDTCGARQVYGAQELLMEMVP